MITYNEETNLPRCLASVPFADEVVILDSYSTDRTVEIAREAGCKVVQREFLGHAAQKNSALEAASNRWVLSLDADEWLMPGAEHAIRQALAEERGDIAGYELARRTYYLGAWIDHSGWWPEYKLRLFDRTRAEWRGHPVHDNAHVDGRVARLDACIGHLSYRDIAHHLDKVNSYTTAVAVDRHERGAKPVGLVTLVGRPGWRFLRMFLFQGGWRKGVRGLIVATIGAFYVFIRYAKLWELQHGQGDPMKGDAE